MINEDEISLFELLNIYKSQQAKCHVVTCKDTYNVNLDLIFI